MSNVELAAYLMSCRERATIRERTVESFARTNWTGAALVTFLDDGTVSDRLAAITNTWRRMVTAARESDADYCLLMEDDLEINAHLEHNIRNWAPLRAGRPDWPFFGSLYNPGRPMLRHHYRENYLIADPWAFWGAQAIVASRATLAYLLRFWDEEDGPPDLKMPRLAARVGPVYYHTPSLVQHVGDVSTWGGISHRASDYDARFRAAGAALAASAAPTAAATAVQSPEFG
jgi:hypothetical protein